MGVRCAPRDLDHGIEWLAVAGAAVLPNRWGRLPHGELPMAD
ncbi:hypothetical protein [Streptomyces sp. NPDC057689]